jgi:hypothetical protein
MGRISPIGLAKAVARVFGLGLGPPLLSISHSSVHNNFLPYKSPHNWKLFIGSSYFRLIGSVLFVFLKLHAIVKGALGNKTISNFVVCILYIELFSFP